MLNSQKLLYILPDVAYITELLPGKKEHTFSVHSFRQINGEFLNETDFIAENIERLVSKIDPEEYTVILPDLLFTNTIVEVKETAEAKVKAYIKDFLLPNLEITKDSHVFDYFILTQHHEKSKVQLSAIEKVALSPLVEQFEACGIKVKGISSLSWSLKSVISLEPSVCVVQMGSHLYTALHYIGVDQTIMSSIDEVENVGETIKTLKGGEPSIQTVYLLTNELVTEKLKEHVSSTLPLQQLSSFSETDSQMPSYVKHAIESAMRSLAITDYHVPVFELPKSADIPKTGKASPEDAKDVEKSDTTSKATEEGAEENVPEIKAVDANVIDNLPTPTKPVGLRTKIVETSTSDALDEKADDFQASVSEITKEEKPEVPEKPTPLASVVESLDDEPDFTSATDKTSLSDSSAKPLVTEGEKTDAISSISPAATVDVAAVDISQFAQSSSNSSDKDAEKEDTDSDTKAEKVETTSTSKTDDETIDLTMNTAANEPPEAKSSETTPVLKHKSEVGSFVRKVFITIAVFFTTVGVGVGVGLGVLSLTQKKSEEVSPLASTIPSPTASPLPSVSPSPSASASASLKRDSLSILVVNATTIPGHAGKTKKLLEDAGYKKVIAGNAKGTYEKGTYLLQKESNAALKQMLEGDTKLTFTVQSNQTIEDPKGEYAAVVVLAE